MRRSLNWLNVIGACGLVVASGCSTTTTGGAAPNQSAAFRWPWSPPAPQQAFATPAATTSDPTSLASKPGKLGPDLYVATAHVYEQAGNREGAAEQYQRALKMEPGNAAALIGYAHLKDSEEQFTESDKLYQTAVKTHPSEAAILNDWALSLQHRKKYNEAIQALTKAIALQPDKTLYRNNIATILVDMNRNDEALKQLTAAHGQAAAHYNLATLLHRKGNDEAARVHFAMAAKADPSLTIAAEWARQLDPRPSQVAETGPHLPVMQQPAGQPQFFAAPPSPEQRAALVNRRPIVADDQPQEVAVRIGGGQIANVSQTSGEVRYPQYLAAPVISDGPLPPSPEQGPDFTAQREASNPPAYR